MINIANEFMLKADVEDVVDMLRLTLHNGKLKDKRDDSTDLVVSCPFHAGGQEEHGSCFIRKKDGVFHCFGCDKKGGLLTFVAGCFDSSADYAKSWLLKTFGGDMIARSVCMDDAIVVGKRQAPKRKLDEAVLESYQHWTPYLAQRKLSREICEMFNVRYDPKYRQVIFPAYDMKGDLVMLAKRSIDTKTFYLDKGVEKPVYCLDRIMKDGYRTAIITEGPFDCLTGWEYGYPTIATFGKLSDYQIEQIGKSCITVLYAMFDNDEAGRRFAEELKRKLDKRIIVVDVSLPDHKKDINDLTKQEFEKAIAKAKNRS